MHVTPPHFLHLLHPRVIPRGAQPQPFTWMFLSLRSSQLWGRASFPPGPQTERQDAGPGLGKGAGHAWGAAADHRCGDALQAGPDPHFHTAEDGDTRLQLQPRGPGAPRLLPKQEERV